MGSGIRRHLGAARARWVRGLAALTLVSSIASTGVTALAGPASAAAPAPTFGTVPASVDSDPTPAWDFSGPSLVGYTCAFGPQGSSPAYIDCGNAFTAPPLAVEGPYTLSVREAPDADPLTGSYTFDKTAGLTLQGPTSPGSTATPVWTVDTTAPGSTASCVLQRPTGSDVAVDCSHGYTLAPALTVDGSYTLDVTYTDVDGNTGVRSSSYVLDTAKPGQPVLTAPQADANDASRLTWSWPTDPDTASAACTLLDPDGVSTQNSCTSLTSYQATLSKQGMYTLTVVVRDAAGNDSDPGVGTYTFDTVAPNAAVFTQEPPTQGTPPRGTDPTPSWTFTFTTPDTTTSCVLQAAGQNDVTFADCQGALDAGTHVPDPYTLTAPALNDGSWTLTVTTRDAAGNSIATTSSSYVLDTTGPIAPTVIVPSTPGNDATPTFTWTAEASSTAECAVIQTDATGTPLSSGTHPWVACDSATSYTPTLTGEGYFTVAVRLTDDLGNLGAEGTSAPGSFYTYDTTAPASFTIAGPTVGYDATPTFTFPVELNGSAICEVRQGGMVVNTDPSCGASSPSPQSGSYQPTLAADGDYTVQVTAYDHAGNPATATHTYTLDQSFPGAPDPFVAPTSPGKTLKPSWGITPNGPAILTCRLLRGGSEVIAPGSCQNGYTADLSDRTAFPDATYVLELTASLDNGRSAVLTSSYRLDTTVPGVPTIVVPTPNPSNALQPVWTIVSADPNDDTTAVCSLVRKGTALPVKQGACAGSFTVTAPLDGEYTLDVQVTDTAGNAAVPVTSEPYISDRTPPGDPTVNGPSGISSLAAVSWSWQGVGEPGLKATCWLYLNNVQGQPVACDNGTFPQALADGSRPPLVSDGKYVLMVQLKDAVGNASGQILSGEYELDRAAPSAPSVSGPSGPANLSTPSWTWREAGAAYSECSGVGASPTTWTRCVPGQTFAPLASDGSYRLQVRLVDAAHNIGDVGVSPFYLYDGSVPAPPTVNAPPSPSKVPSASFSIGAEAGAVVECRVLQGTVLVEDWIGCSGSKDLNLTGKPDAGYVVEARQTDSAGNHSLAGASAPYVLDTLAPPVPVVTGPTGPATTTAPQFTFTGEQGALATCRLVHDDVPDPAANPCSSPYSPILRGDGRWVLRVRLTDLAGNVGEVGTSPTFVLDTTPPSAPTVTAPASPGRGAFPSWSAAVEPGTTTSCRLTTGSTVVSDWSTCLLPVVTDLTGRADGTYVLGVRSSDAVGLTSAVGSASYTLDTTAPAAPSFTAIPPSPSRVRTGSFSFTSEAGTTVTCSSPRGASVLVTTPCTSPAGLDLTGLPDGSYAYTVRASDSAGNVGPAASAVQILDTTAPAAPVLVTGPAASTSVRTPSWAFTAESGATLTCKITSSAGAAVLPDRSCTSPFAADLRGQADDTYTLSVRASDPAGNTGPPLVSSVTLSATAVAPPVVVAPASPSRTATAVWKVTAAGGTAQCRLVLGATVLKDWVTCGPTYAADLRSGDGSYVLHARTAAAGGKYSAEVLSRYVLDTVQPAGPVLAAPASPSTDRAPAWTLSSPEMGATATCAVLRPGGSVARAFASCGVSPAGVTYPLDLTGAVDGSWILVVQLADAAGNAAPEVRSSYVLDTVAPSSVLIQAPASPSSLETPTWLLTGDSDAVLDCRLSGPGVPALAFAPCRATAGVPGSSSYTADLTTLGDGTYTLSVRSRDAAGNLGPEVSSGYTINRQIPPAVPDLLAPASPSQEPVASFTFTAPAGTTTLCTLRSATEVKLPEQPCTSPVTEDLTAYGDGDYSLGVRVRDSAGNTSPAVVVHYVFDTTAPLPPVITGSPAARGPSTTPRWALSPSAVDDKLSCRLIGLPSPTWEPCTSPVSYDLGTASSGTFTLEVREVDLAGNVSPVTTAADYVLDPTAAAIVTVTPPTPARDSTRQPVFTVVRDPADTRTDHVVCTVERFDTKPARTTVPCSFGPVAVDLPGLAGEGEITLFVVAVDGVGNVGAPASAKYLFDGRAPDRPVLPTPSPSEGFEAKSTWSWAGPTDVASFLCELRKDGASVPVVPVAACRSPYEASLSAGPGLYTLSVWSVDSAGNRSSTPAQASYRWLSEVPAGTAARGPATGSDATPTWTFTVPGSYGVTCLLGQPDGSASTSDCTPSAAPRGIGQVALRAAPGLVQGPVAGLTTGPVSTTFTANLTGRPGGVYTFAFRLTDAYDNDGAYGPRASYRYVPGAATGPGNPGTGAGTGGAKPSTGAGRPAGTTTPPGSSVGNGPSTAANPGPIVKALDRILYGSKGSKWLAGGLRTRPGFTLGAEVPKAIKNTLAEVVKRPTIPLLLLVVVIGFLLLQNQIDRRDPKLASAPVGAEPELDFGPALRANPVGRTWGRGAPA